MYVRALPLKSDYGATFEANAVSAPKSNLTDCMGIQRGQVFPNRFLRRDVSNGCVINDYASIPMKDFLNSAASSNFKLSWSPHSST